MFKYKYDELHYNITHIVCKDKINRDCDTVAEIASDIITYILKGLSIKGNHHRSNFDLNRDSARNTEYRKSLDLIFSLYKKNSIVLDIHSFPNYYMDIAGDINFFKKNEIAPDIVLMTGSNDFYKGVSISQSLFNGLKYKYKVKIISNVDVLDILNQANKYKLGGILLEFNEKYKNNIKDLEILCKIICNIITSTIA